MQIASDRLADDIVAYLGDSVSVNLVGLTGSGRTRVLTRAGDRLRERGLAVVTVRGVAALRDRSLAVLALAGVDLAGASAAMAVPHAVAGLTALLPAGRSALLIDDADDLDPASAGVVAAAQAERRFPVLTVSRPAERRQSPAQALIDNLQPGVRLRVDPLAFDQLHRLVHDVLPGTVDPAAVAQIATLSGGLPGLVLALVDAGCRTGALSVEHRIWRAKGTLWDDRLAHAVEPLLGGLDDDELAALTRLAHHGTVAPAEARDLLPGPLRVRLEHLGLLEVSTTAAGTVVGVFPPLAAEYLRRTGTAGEVSATARTDREPLTSSRVAQLNTRIIDHWRVEVAGLRSAWQAAPTAENATALLSALDEAGAAPQEFEAVLRGVAPTADDSIWTIRLLVWEALYRGVLLGDFDTARDLLQRRRMDAPQFADHLRAGEAALCLAAGVVPPADLLSPPGPDADDVTRAALDRARRHCLTYAGLTTDALAGLSGAALPDYPEALRRTIVLTKVFHGELDTGIGWALQAMAAAEDRLDAGQILEYAYLAGMALVFAGRLDEAQALLDPVLALTGPTMMHEYYHAGVLGLSALAARWRGQTDYGEALTAQAEAIGRRSGPFPEILRAEADPGAAWAVVAERCATGHVAAGISLAVAAAEARPDPAGVALAVAYADGTQSPFFRALGHYIAAVGAADVDGLAACVAELGGLGATVYAVKAGVTRALILRARGDLTQSVRQAEAAWEQAGTHGQVPVGVFFPLGRALGFTAREQEIALLLADGLSSQAIATTLGLSQRTVENYLSSAYRKLGSTGRADLVRAVTTWAAAG